MHIIQTIKHRLWRVWVRVRSMGSYKSGSTAQSAYRRHTAQRKRATGMARGRSSSVRSIVAASLLFPALITIVKGAEIDLTYVQTPMSTPEPVIISLYAMGNYTEILDLDAQTLSSTSTPLELLIPDEYSQAVIPLQSRLMELGYMEADEPTDFYGETTKNALSFFQRQHAMEETGIIDEATYGLLFSEEASTYCVSLDAQGVDIIEIQKRLKELDYMDKATGFFGELTESAVREFQSRNALPVDGKVDMQTRELIYSQDACPHVLSSGMKGEEVQALQQRLKDLVYLQNVDGIFGKETTDALKNFQDRNGLIADGHLGPQTKTSLFSSSAISNTLSEGARGSDVQKLQQRLKELKYMSDVTGYFGSATQQAVRDFQQRNALSVDGAAGKQTLSRLYSDSAKKAAATTSGNKSNTNNSSNTSKGSTTAPKGNNSSQGSSKAPSSDVDKFIRAAESKLGAPYVWGAKGPSEFDCSGLVYWCLNQAGVKQGYLTSSAWHSVTKYTKITSMSSIKRGDVIVYDGHVGIAIGSGQMIDASSGRGIVVKRSFQTSYWQDRFYCAYRIF